jgi:hypothetical protein
MDGTLFFIIVVLFGVFALGGILYATLNRDGAIPVDRATPYGSGGDYASKELYTAVPAHRTQLRELTAEERDHFDDIWRGVQSGFIEDPAGAARRADELAREVLEARGYSLGEIDGEMPGLGIDRSEAVENYRTARALTSAQEMEPEDSNRLLQAMDHYHALFTELLVAPPAAA